MSLSVLFGAAAFTSQLTRAGIGQIIRALTIGAVEIEVFLQVVRLARVARRVRLLIR
ncbi:MULTISPECIES: hypothetical protein [unclassified Ochrobactrum]|uniref:hypothetical protein n=1 Tax=unclassified Ochrobactrum TaxID=239106 RepID=UPI0013B440B8|nr:MULTISPECIES: hypothetical protein [unclassified Ochrobactrum]MBQ0710375.1 hypothetical protein [Ochrobactrum sp. AP1BH01-1]